MADRKEYPLHALRRAVLCTLIMFPTLGGMPTWRSMACHPTFNVIRKHRTDVRLCPQRPRHCPASEGGQKGIAWLAAFSQMHDGIAHA